MRLRCRALLFAARNALTPELAHAKELLAAIDASGVPLNPVTVNRMARELGLEVSRLAPDLIRAAVARCTL